MALRHWPRKGTKDGKMSGCGYGSIPINTIFSGMDIHLPAILGFTRYQGFDPSPCLDELATSHGKINHV